MSHDKYQSKRAYSIRGAVTKRKLRKAKAGGGKKSQPGHTYISVCPECPPRADGSAVPVGAKTKLASCKQGHTWRVV